VSGEADDSDLVSYEFEMDEKLDDMLQNQWLRCMEITPIL